MNENLTQTNENLGILIVGIGGAVATTFVTGTLLARKNQKKPIGSFTQMGHLDIHGKPMPIKDAVPLADLHSLVFGGWDIFEENLYESTCHAAVLKKKDIDSAKEELKKIVPMRAVFDQQYVKRLHGTWIKNAPKKWELMEQLREDIRRFKTENKCERAVMLWCGSTEVYLEQTDVHQQLEVFEEGMKTNNAMIAPSMLYAYAALSENVPFINGAPNLTTDFPAMLQLAAQQQTAICGKDFKTGQTLLKTVLAPMFRDRILGVKGWFSTNILGNRDGEVLDDPDSFHTKEVSKLSVIESVLSGNTYPELYDDIYHKVRINYFPPRNDNKESWDNIDFFGWLGYPMQMKVNVLWKDSILAAPLCLDLVLLMDLAQRNGFSNIQPWLSFYFKSPMIENSNMPEHDFFQQKKILEEKLKEIKDSI